MKRGVLTLLAALGAFLVVTPITVFAVLLLAGPRAGLLPQPLEVAVVALGWGVVLGVPAFVARKVWRR